VKRGRKRKLRSRKTKKPFVRKPWKRCAVCLYQIGFTSLSISEKLHISPESVRVLLFHSGVRRKPLKRISKRFQKESALNRLIIADYRRQRHCLKLLDESRHWWNHPERIAWSGRKIARKISKARLAQKLLKFKCQFCGCDASAIPVKRRRSGLKYCSTECSKKARIAADKLRLQSDPQFWQRKSVARKKCYHRKRRERPEVYRAEVRRKLENPQYRIAKAHRTRIFLLVKKGKMIKTQTSLKYFGCTRTHLKRHLISQFKPGMTWENYGKVWQVDHIIPLDSFDLLNPTECTIAFNWQNLQPMFARPNLMKSNKVTNPQQSLPLVMV
jgi:hypothetical protein